MPEQNLQYDARHTATAIYSAPVAKYRFVSWAGAHATDAAEVQGISELAGAAGKAGSLVTTYSYVVEAAAAIPVGSTVGPSADGTGRAVVAGSSGCGRALTAAAAAGELLTVALRLGGGVVSGGVISNDGTRDILRLPAGGWLQVGTAAQTSAKELVNFTQVNSNSTSAVRPVFMLVEQAVNPATAGTFDWHGIDAKTYGGGANTNFSGTSGLYAIEGKSQFSGTIGQTMGKIVGVFGMSAGIGTDYTLNLAIGVQGETQNSGAGTTVAARAFSAKSPTVSAGEITTAYGFYAESITAGLTNYSVFTNAGRVKFFGGTAPPAGGAAGVGITVGSTADLGVFFGSGAPTLAAAKGSMYLRTDGSSTSTRMYVNTDGATAWTAITTAS